MKVKICKVDGCDNESITFPNSTIKGRYCRDHSISQALTKVRLNKVKSARKERTQKTDELMSADQYRSKHVQPIINEIARLIDYGQPCIATGLMPGKMSGGHYFSVGSNRTICLNLHNIHVQSFHSNSAMGGDNIRYRQGIIKTYGSEYMKLIESLKQIEQIKLTKDDLKQVKVKASEIRNTLKKNLKVRTPVERMKLRELINEQLGIYDSLY